MSQSIIFQEVDQMVVARFKGLPEIFKLQVWREAIKTKLISDPMVGGRYCQRI